MLKVICQILFATLCVEALFACAVQSSPVGRGGKSSAGYFGAPIHTDDQTSPFEIVPSGGAAEAKRVLVISPHDGRWLPRTCVPHLSPGFAGDHQALLEDNDTGATEVYDLNAADQIGALAVTQLRAHPARAVLDLNRFPGVELFQHIDDFDPQLFHPNSEVHGEFENWFRNGHASPIRPFTAFGHQIWQQPQARPMPQADCRALLESTTLSYYLTHNAKVRQPWDVILLAHTMSPTNSFDTTATGVPGALRPLFSVINGGQAGQYEPTTSTAFRLPDAQQVSALETLFAAHWDEHLAPINPTLELGRSFAAFGKPNVFGGSGLISVYDWIRSHPDAGQRKPWLLVVELNRLLIDNLPADRAQKNIVALRHFVVEAVQQLVANESAIER